MVPITPIRELEEEAVNMPLARPSRLPSRFHTESVQAVPAEFRAIVLRTMARPVRGLGSAVRASRPVL